MKILNRLVFRRNQNTNKLTAESEYIQVVELDDGSIIEGLGEINTLSPRDSEWLLSQNLADLGFNGDATFRDVITGTFDKLRSGEISPPPPPGAAVEE